jgi:4-oxalocrotonate tautomerase
MPFLQLTIIEGRSPEKKEELIAELTETIHRVVDAPYENIRVSINEIPAAHWGIAGKSIKKRQEEQEGIVK